MTETPSPPEVRPRLRGRLHQAAFFVTIPAGLALVASTRTTAARVGSIVYALSLTGLFGTSAAYHRRSWSPRARRWMQRLDHSMIFVLIAGTYTPFVLLVLHGAWSVAILILVWGVAAVGILLKILRIDGFQAVTGALYVSLGWAAVVGLPQILRELSGVAIALMFTGGLLYTVGAIVLARRRPDPDPRVFGYHEVWHAFTLGGAACHYSLIVLIVSSVR